MKEKIKLLDIQVTSLSTETINLIGQLVTGIRKRSKQHFKFTDPKLLPKLSHSYKKVNDPELTALYKSYKRSLKESLAGQLRAH